jgi:hypothetical protein
VVGCCEHDKEVTGIIRNVSRTELLLYSQEEICSVRLVSQIIIYLYFVNVLAIYLILSLFLSY